MRKTTHALLLVFGASMFGISSAMAEWTVQKDPMGPGWLVTNGDKVVRAKTEKNAKKKAKILNRDAAEVKSDPEGPCDDPRSGVNC